jgi:spore germination cell wall hydrolase CwlJ-like protein
MKPVTVKSVAWVILLLSSAVVCFLDRVALCPVRTTQHIFVELAIPAPKPIFLVTSSFSHPMYCLAQNIYFEARGETISGQFAVGMVTINRLLSSKFPNNVCDVVYQRHYKVCQFSWRCDQYEDKPKLQSRAWRRARMVALGLWYGYYKHNFLRDKTNGALYFFNPHKVSVRTKSASIVSIDHQIYYR